MKTKQEFSELINSINWDDKNKIESFLLPAINVTSEEKNIEIGESKFGGEPDLPIHTDWPKYQDESLIFLAQINLKEIQEFYKNDLLPKSGMLYFFISNPENFDLEHQVIFSDNLEVENRKFPEDVNDDCKFNSLKMCFEKIYTLPSTETIEIDSLSENDYDLFYDIDEDFLTYENNQVLGHHYPMQADVRIEWACQYLGIEFGEGYQIHIEEIDKLKNEFVNLFQFSAENSLPELWDNFFIDSMGYFGIKHQDLIDKKFENTVLIYQNT